VRNANKQLAVLRPTEELRHVTVVTWAEDGSLGRGEATGFALVRFGPCRRGVCANRANGATGQPVRSRSHLSEADGGSRLPGSGVDKSADGQPASTVSHTANEPAGGSWFSPARGRLKWSCVRERSWGCTTIAATVCEVLRRSHPMRTSAATERSHRWRAPPDSLERAHAHRHVNLGNAVPHMTCLFQVDARTLR
jgi:hypothetical protein